MLRLRLLAIAWSVVVLTLLAAPRDSNADQPIDDEIAQLKRRQELIQHTLEKVSRSVVSISDGAGAGSGVIVSEDGYVLTAGHVLLTSEGELDVTLWDGTLVKAKPLGRNLNFDAGMAKIQGDGPFPFIEPATTRDLDEGDWCLALGHPGGYQLGRTPPLRVGRLLGQEDWLLITDCALIGGDSGGPLFDLQGRLIGIHSSIGASLSQNRHVRIDHFHDYWDRLVAGESWGRLGGVGPPDRDSAYLGVQLDSQANRALVVEVVEGSAAAEAGVEPGDVVVELDGTRIRDSDDLVAQVIDKSAGREFTVGVLRDGRRLNLRGRLSRYRDFLTR